MLGSVAQEDLFAFSSLAPRAPTGTGEGLSFFILDPLGPGVDAETGRLKLRSLDAGGLHVAAQGLHTTIQLVHRGVVGRVEPPDDEP